MDPTDLMVRALQGVPEDIGDPNLQWRDPVPATASMVKGLYGGLEDTAKRAIGSADVYSKTGEYDPEPVVKAATMAAGGATPFAEAGAAGIFGGRLAHTADLDRLKFAQKLRIIENAPKSDIFAETGWWIGPDGKWRFEIPDTKAGLNENLLHQKAAKFFDEEGIVHELPTQGARYVTHQGNYIRGIPELSNYTVKQVMQHPELYNAYPSIPKMSVYSSEVPEGAGFFKGGFGEPPSVDLGPARLSYMRPHLLHELQHAVQQREGFASGGSPDIAFKGRKPTTFLEYAKLPGEVEARNVEIRSALTPTELEQYKPWETGNFAKLNPWTEPRDIVQALRNRR